MGEHVRNFMDRLKHDRKLALMLVLLAVGLLLWGRLLLQRPVPQVATAEPRRAAASAAAANAEATLKAVQVDRPTVAVTLPDYLERDLFNFPTDEVAWALPKKSPDEPAEEKSAPERSDDQLRSATVRKAAEGLRLRSVMMGGETPSAVINGQVLRPGQQIQGFTLLEISERHVLLEQHGVIVRLKM